MIALLELAAQARRLVVQPLGFGSLAVECGLDRGPARALGLELVLELVGAVMQPLDLVDERIGAAIGQGRRRSVDRSDL